MKIKNSELFYADIYSTKKHDFSGDFGTLQSGLQKVRSNAIFLKTSYMYVPVEHIHGLFGYLMLKAHASSFGTIKENDHRYYSGTPHFNSLGDITYLKNITPFRNGNGKSNLSELKDLQIDNDLLDPCQRTGGMEFFV